LISNHTTVQLLRFYANVSLYACSILFKRYPTSNNDRQQCKRCFVVELSNAAFIWSCFNTACIEGNTRIFLCTM